MYKFSPARHFHWRSLVLSLLLARLLIERRRARQWTALTQMKPERRGLECRAKSGACMEQPRKNKDYSMGAAGPGTTNVELSTFFRSAHSLSHFGVKHANSNECKTQIVYIFSIEKCLHTYALISRRIAAVFPKMTQYQFNDTFQI